MSKYLLTTGAKSYNSKADPTNLPPETLVAGSQNVIINDQERVETRAGYEIFGAVAAGSNPVKSEFDWKHSSEGEILLREINGTLQFYSETSDAFETLLAGLSATYPVRFTTVWNGTELIDILLFVNHSAVLYEWSGGAGTFASATATTIDINEVIASSRFLTSGTREIRVKDSGGTWRTFAYTGQSGSQFTGVTPDPTAFTFTAGALVIQEVRSNSSTPAAGFINDVIEVFQNQIFFGSSTSQRLYVSSNTSYTSVSFSSPRVAGEGALITLDATCVGLKAPGMKDTDTESKVIAFCRGNRAYKITFEISPGSAADREVPRVKPLAIAEGQGALSQELIAKVKNTIVWLSTDKELIDLGQIEGGSFKEAISDPIKSDFANAVFTNGDIKFWRSSIFITAPADGRVYVYDVSKGFWQPPQIMGMRKLSIYADLLYGHSNAVDETYRLFSGSSDNSNPIAFKAHWSYRNSGERALLKNFDRFFTELYIQSNTTVSCSILFEWKGAKRILTWELDGSDASFLFTPNVDASLGVNPLGTNPLGGQLEAGENTPKYRRFKTIQPTDHFEYQIRLESDEVDDVWQALSTGSNALESNNLPTNLTK